MRRELFLVLFVSSFVYCNAKYKLLENRMEVPVCAEDIWDVYSSPKLPKLIVKLLPSVFEKIDMFGDGRVGTVLNITFPRGSVPRQYMEEFVTLDHQKRIKDVQQIKNGYLALGCTFYMDSFIIIKTGRNRCIIQSSTRYVVPDDLAYMVEPYISIDSLVGMAKAISKYVLYGGLKELNGTAVLQESI